MPFRSISMTVRQPFQERSSVGQIKFPAALHTKISMPPIFSAKWSKDFLIPSGSLTSPVHQATSISSESLNSLTADTKFSSFRETIPTFAPKAPNFRTMKEPIPVAPPVTIALFPVNIPLEKLILPIPYGLTRSYFSNLWRPTCPA